MQKFFDSIKIELLEYFHCYKLFFIYFINKTYVYKIVFEKNKKVGWKSMHFTKFFFNFSVCKDFFDKLYIILLIADRVKLKRNERSGKLRVSRPANHKNTAKWVIGEIQKSRRILKFFFLIYRYHFF